ncbi:MAG: DUF2007 domain-containing protein [Actinobacteria bacterium]|nr:DUF2007 domain-containing protein [Actinomycetota bacterium]
MTAANELVRLTVVANQPEAEMIRGLLATNGIESMYRMLDFAAGAWDGYAVAGAREIMVYAGDLEMARELVTTH